SFQADARDVEGDAIVRALWDPGDGSDPEVFTNLTPFTHFYASVPGQTVGYVLTLTVDDARGGQKSIQRDVVLTANSAGQQLVVQLQQTHACGCRTMTVFSRTPAVAGQV